MIADEKLWGRMKEVVALIDEARARGVNVQANVYPYTRRQTTISSASSRRGRTRADAQTCSPASRTPPASAPQARDQRRIARLVQPLQVRGRRLAADAHQREQPVQGPHDAPCHRDEERRQSPPPDPLDVLFDLLLEQEGTVSTVFAHHTEEDMNLALIQPWCSIGSDGSALATNGILRRGNPHPRNFGTFPACSALCARARVLRLEERRAQDDVAQRVEDSASGIAAGCVRRRSPT